MKYENPICEIVELDVDIVTASNNDEPGTDDTPVLPTV
jgi:hypothetical protein